MASPLNEDDDLVIYALPVHWLPAAVVWARLAAAACRGTLVAAEGAGGRSSAKRSTTRRLPLRWESLLKIFRFKAPSRTERYRVQGMAASQVLGRAGGCLARRRAGAEMRAFVQQLKRGAPRHFQRIRR